LFSLNSVLFTMAGRRVGSVVVNRTRLVFALLFLVGAHLVLGMPFPLHYGMDRYAWLALSGIVGLSLGDAFLFQAFLWIGPRLTMLLMSLGPILAAVLSWLFLGESLTARQVLGMLLALAGVIWVVLSERNGNENGQNPSAPVQHDLARGLVFGLLASAGQATGLVLAKLGLGTDFPPLSGTLVRMLAATLILWGITLFQRQAEPTLRRLVDQPRATLLIFAGAFSGPFLGVTLSLVAVQRTAVGVASTIMAISPILLLPVGYFVFKERFRWPAVLGTFLAIAGVALLFLA